jgi:hypothetical protein
MGKRDIGAAKGTASPGPDIEPANESLKEKQFKGPGPGQKPVTNESASDAGSAEERGMTSAIARKHWDKTGYKIPKTSGNDDNWK